MSDIPNFLPPERTCAICKKHFYAMDGQYAYVRGAEYNRLYFCSYSCMRAYDRNEKPKKINEKREAILRLRKAGKSRREVAIELGLPDHVVAYYDVKYGGL